MSNPNPWTTLSSRIVYENPWFSVREDSVLRPDGTEGTYSVVQLPKSVGVVAIDDGGNVALVSQWRYVHGKTSLEIPTGGVDEGDSTLAIAAARELEEETGLRARRLSEIGSIDNSNGATTDVATLFLAEDLHEGKKTHQSDERTTLVWIPFANAVQMAMDGQITESTSVAALLRVAMQRNQ